LRPRANSTTQRDIFPQAAPTRVQSTIRSITMGKGDRKTAKGKRYNSSYGNSRSSATTKAAGAPSAPVAKKTAASKTVTKMPAKKAVAKKAAAKS
jgi:30S ribosomal protein S31